ncbi:hypothetical protein ARMSODRAFT_429881 [Armillaria solidipes]|uniref:Uncharacterized protein n=1 Tax=Armillaria solidipes TaxID=1076256 RepID=A0A2H3B9P8_9AGAR|nr:hypothetical protein ARMSODRAFT_429881 [Armillaria solidipes]
MACARGHVCHRFLRTPLQAKTITLGTIRALVITLSPFLDLWPPPLPHHIDNDEAQYVILRAVPRVVGPRPIYKHVQSRPLFLPSSPPSTMPTNVGLLRTLNSPAPSISQAHIRSSTFL